MQKNANVRIEHADSKHFYDLFLIIKVKRDLLQDSIKFNYYLGK